MRGNVYDRRLPFILRQRGGGITPVVHRATVGLRLLEEIKYNNALNRRTSKKVQGATTMVNKELLAILCCPETKQDLTVVEESMIATINQRIKEGTLKNRADETIKEPIDGGLLREDRAYLYPIREDIPIMLIDEAIPCREFFS
jgi:uncharacterized protein YbaR (Trm112 family)